MIIQRKEREIEKGIHWGEIEKKGGIEWSWLLMASTRSSTFVLTDCVCFFLSVLCTMELSLAEIRNFMINNGCKVTNHALVKHFKEFLTNPDTQSKWKFSFHAFFREIILRHPMTHWRWRKSHFLTTCCSNLTWKSSIRKTFGLILLLGTLLGACHGLFCLKFPCLFQHNLTLLVWC